MVSHEFMSEVLKNKFIDNALTHLRDRYTLDNGQNVQGQSVSYLIARMRDDGWKNLGSLYDFECTLENVGFTVARGRNNRGNHARVVTV